MSKDGFGAIGEPFSGPDTEHTDLDWFGNPIDEHGRRPRDPVPCPRCGEPFTDAAGLRAHLSAAHAIPVVRRNRRFTPTVRRLRRWAHSLRFVPLWFVLPLNAVLVGLVWVSVRDPLWNPPASLLVRVALLPSILVLAARVAGSKP